MNDFIRFLSHEFQLPLQNPVLVFSVILFIILLSPIILRKINIPSIIGLIISGVAIGPFGFNIIEKNFGIELFSTIGLLYIMFIAGLELDIIEFNANRNKSIVFGILTFIIPMIFGYPICYYLLGLDFNASLLISSMFATHTLVAYPIVSGFGISKKLPVAISVGGTILTDTAVLIIFAIILGNHYGSLNGEFWLKLIVSLLIFSVIMFAIIPKIARWFFQKLDSEKHAHFIFVLSILFLSAFLAEASGLESIIGAFVAGLALNKLIPHSSALMNRIEYIGNSLFIPFFLISVGMIVDISVLLNGYMAITVALTLTASALLGKYFAAKIIQYTFKFTKYQGNLIFGLTSAHAAATLAIIMIGFRENIIDENVLNGTIILILITCLVSSLVTESASKNIILYENKEVEDKGKLHSLNGNKIIVSVSNLQNIEKFIEFALLIKTSQSNKPITILSVVPNNQEAEKNIMVSKRELEKYVSLAKASDSELDVIATIDHNVPSGIARSSKEVMADIVFIGWPHKTDLIDKIIGEQIDAIIKIVDKTLFVCKIIKPIITYNRIVLFIPPLIENEDDFDIIFNKIAKLSKELSASIYIYCNDKTKDSIKKFYRKMKISIDCHFNKNENWNKIGELMLNINLNDLIILVNPRKGLISYETHYEHLPTKIDKICEHNSKIIIYPKKKPILEHNESFGDVSPTI
jgi:Kef-type K+ transport system membrane component KefB